jgi:pyruvate/2-oxoglutarate dehydrogenase complex dihydrolipoamide acyltransferase (E2) component
MASTRKAIVAPDLGCPNVVVSVWYVKPGEKVHPGDRLVELLAGSATFDVTSADNGTLVEHCVWPGDVLTPKQVLGKLDVIGD